MTDTKPAYTSIGVMGPFIARVVMGLNQFVFKGSVITDSDATTIINELAGLFAAVTGIYGRWKATKIVTLTGKP
jgi:uncharacterized membrane protein